MVAVLLSSTSNYALVCALCLSTRKAFATMFTRWILTTYLTICRPLRLFRGLDAPDLKRFNRFQ